MLSSDLKTSFAHNMQFPFWELLLFYLRCLIKHPFNKLMLQHDLKNHQACLVLLVIVFTFSLHDFHSRWILFSCQTYAWILLHISCGLRLLKKKAQTCCCYGWFVVIQLTEKHDIIFHYQRKTQYYSGDNHSIPSDPHKASVSAFWRHAVTFGDA